MATNTKPIEQTHFVVSGKPARRLVSDLCKVLLDDFTPSERKRRAEREKELAEVRNQLVRNGNPWGIK
jgi:hypothetical protein